MFRIATVALIALLAQAAAAQVTMPADYGDAPAPYPTCEHQFAYTPTARWLNIGKRMSDDSLGPNPVSGGISGDTFDDGVRFTDIRPSTGQYDYDTNPRFAPFEVVCWTGVANQDVMGVWMDFNDDGDWDDAGEQVVYSVCGGLNQIAQGGIIAKGFRAADPSYFNIAMPNSLGASVKVRVRVWNGVLSTGPFAIGPGNWGSPSGSCVGGECEDHEFFVDGDPELRVSDFDDRDFYSGGDYSVRALTPQTPNPIYWRIWNSAELNVALNIHTIVVSNEVNCTVDLDPNWPAPILLSKQTEITYNPHVTPAGDFCSFTITLTHDDGTGNEQPFIINFKGACGLNGNYVIDNTANAAADYTSIGAAFDALEKRGILGPVDFTIHEGDAPYQSDSSCGLGIQNNMESDRGNGAEIWGAWTNQGVRFHAATGEHPVIEGSGAAFRVGNEEYHATIALANPYVSIEGLEIRGGQHFGLVLINEFLMICHHATVSGCRVHDIAQGPGIALVSYYKAQSVTIENNMVWNCGVGGVNVKSLYTGASNPQFNVMCGSISIWGGRDITLRYNTVRTKSSNTAGATCAAFSISEGAPAIFSGNIISQADATQPALYMLKQSDKPPVAEYNCYQFGSVIARIEEGAATFASLSAWQSASNGAFNIEADPKFRRLVAPVDLHLKGTSPLVDAIPNSAASPAKDLDGDTRPQRGSLDIGADECPPDPAMSVNRQGAPIGDGSIDSLGAGIQPGVPTDIVYTIVNSGQGALVLTGQPRVKITNTVGCLANVAQPLAVVAPNTNAAFTISVTAPNGAFELDIEILSNDPVFDTYNWHLEANDAPVITVTLAGAPVTPGAVLSFPCGTGIGSIGLQIHVANPNAGELVTLTGQVAGGVFRGMQDSEFSSIAAPAPYIISPSSGALDAALGSSHLVTLVAHDGRDSTTFSFTLEGQHAIMLLEVRQGGTDGALLAPNAPTNGTPRSFAIRDVKAGPSAAVQITVRNIGTTTFAVNEPTMSGGGAADFRVDLAGFQPMIPPGGASMFYISFDPRTVGTRIAGVTLVHQATNEVSPFEIPVEGVAVDVPPIDIVSVEFAAGRQFQEYPTISLSCTGGLAPYTWSLHSGSLPEGISLSAAGEISGYITGNAGDYFATARVTDLLGNHSELSVPLHVKVGQRPNIGPGLAGKDAGAACSGNTEGGWLAILALMALATTLRLRRRTQ